MDKRSEQMGPKENNNKKKKHIIKMNDNNNDSNTFIWWLGVINEIVFQIGIKKNKTKQRKGW